ncbi:MAG TPA: phosphopyruvate hydratase [Chlamydiales bacterium]|nr:phosphopyruvate hydratase [Chlamydiales bacterium]
MTIKTLHALEILDSRGNPTVEVILTTDKDIEVKAAVPSGASTGEHEAVELRDNDPKRYQGKGVKKAVENINTTIFQKIKGKSVLHQKELDHALITLDGTENKSKLGANAILGVSLAVARAGAATQKVSLFRYLNPKATSLPCPMMNILNGGKHADNGLEFQEFMIRPKGAKTFKEALRWGVEVYHVLKAILKKKGLSASVGDEGGFAPQISSHEEALDLIVHAIEKAGFNPGKEISLALDPAASEFFQDGKYLGSKTSEEMVSYFSHLKKSYPIDSIEDGLDQNDWEGWKKLNAILGKDTQIVGDDIFVTNPKFLKKGIKEKAANAILIKLNQIGTLTETLDAIELAHKNNFATIISHRSGETGDAFIADLAVATNAGQIKTGAPCRSDRTTKYNRLLEIEDELGPKAKFLDSNKFAI